MSWPGGESVTDSPPVSGTQQQGQNQRQEQDQRRRRGAPRRLQGGCPLRVAAASSLQSSRLITRRSCRSRCSRTRRLLPRSVGEAAAPPFRRPGPPVVLSGRAPAAPTVQSKVFLRPHQRVWPVLSRLFEMSAVALFSDSGSAVFMSGYRGGVAKNKVTTVDIQRPAFSGNLMQPTCCVCPTVLFPKGVLSEQWCESLSVAGACDVRPYRRHLRLGWTASRARGTYVSLEETDISLFVDGSGAGFPFHVF